MDPLTFMLSSDRTREDKNSRKNPRDRDFKLEQRSVLNGMPDYNEKQTQLQNLVQQIYQAESAVKKETAEVRHLQGLVSTADRELEEASNQVRSLSLELQEAQRMASQRALKSHTAHLQLSAHDQLMFTARQRVDAISAQIIAAQAEAGMWPPGAYYSNGSGPLESADQSAQLAPFPPEIIGVFGKAPSMHRNVAAQPPYYAVPNGFQYIPVETE